VFKCFINIWRKVQAVAQDRGAMPDEFLRPLRIGKEPAFELSPVEEVVSDSTDIGKKKNSLAIGLLCRWSIIISHTTVDSSQLSWVLC